MKRNNLLAFPATEAGFTVRCLRACARLARELNRVKNELTGHFQQLLDLPAPWLQQSVNEAEALAWQAGFPHLLFPVLAEEKVRKLGRWYNHQQKVQRQNYQDAA